MMDQASEKALLSKVTWRLIPFMFLLYIVAYLDRVNVSFAKLQMQQELGFSEAVFGFGMGVFFWGYFLLEVPSNLILERVGARLWIARIMITWGLLAAAMMFVKSVTAFYVLRFSLGLAEAGFFPGMILYLTYWFPAAERARAVGRFMTATAIANVVGGPVSGALLGLHGLGGLHGWQWLFLIEGLPSCILGLVVLFYLPNGPRDAKWLNPQEREWIAGRLEHDDAGSAGKHATLKEALLCPRVWLLCAIYFAQATGSYGFGLWLPSLIKDRYHLGNFQTGLLSAVPYLFAVVGLLAFGASSDRRRERRLHVAGAALWGATCIAAAGLLLAPGLLPIPDGLAASLALVALILAPIGTSGTLGPFWSLSSSMLAGTAAAGGIALINSVGNLGGFVGPYAMGVLKQYSKGFTMGLLFTAGAYFLLAVLVLCVRTPAARPVAASAGHPLEPEAVEPTPV